VAEHDSGVSVAELLAALSLGTDLGLGQSPEHVLRMCVLALGLAERLGLEDSERSVVYYVALLAWVGCCADSYEQARWFGDDIEARADYYPKDLIGANKARFVMRHVGAGEAPGRRAGRVRVQPPGRVREARAPRRGGVAMNATIATPTASQQAHAEQLVSEPGKWSRGRSKQTGQAFWLIQGSKGTAHYATASGCTCRGFYYCGTCSHQLAVKVREDRERAARLMNDHGAWSACRGCGILVPPIARGLCQDCAADMLGA
jgi:hypothetical protein